MKKLLIIVSVLILLCGCKANLNDTPGEGFGIDESSLTYTDSAGKYELSVTKEDEGFASDCTFSVNGDVFPGTLELKDNQGTITFDGIKSALGTDATMVVVYKDKCFYLTGGFIYSTDGDSIEDTKSFWLTDEKLSLE